MKKTWIGEYRYSFDDSSQGCSFEINAIYSKGSFEGTVYEEEFSGLTGDLVHVKGFIDDDLISFIKTYPYFFGTDDDDNIVVDKQLKGHFVEYEGRFDEEKGCWSGNWEIVVYEERDPSIPDAYYTEYILGPWTMRLKDSI